jgi:hypothetical protein
MTPTQWEGQASPGGLASKRDDPWNEKPTIGQHVRFNATEIAAIHAHADRRDMSQQKMIRTIVRNWLRSPAQRLVPESDQTGPTLGQEAEAG